LLIDADMRRPSIHKVFGIGGQIGLSNILTGGAKISDGIQATVQPNLFVIPAGPIPPHPSELLGSSLMQELLKVWRDEHDHVIVDSPPVISVTDAVLLSAQVDAVMLIIRSGQTTNNQVRRSRDLLLSVNANLLGVVVNAADLTSPDYYNYYYGSKYRYYADKKNADVNVADGRKQGENTSQDDQPNVATKTS
jgi:succinoglycan biosynthesis transport protein ExoP